MSAIVRASFGHPQSLVRAGLSVWRRRVWVSAVMSKASFGRGTRQAAMACSVAALTAACSQTSGPSARPAATDSYDSKFGVSSSPRLADAGPARKGGGSYKLGNPYKIAERWYVPREEPGYDRQGIGSWYGDDFHGRKTANGEIYDMRGLSAAHPTLPMPSYVYVTNEANGRTLLVRVNDRGPYAQASGEIHGKLT